MKKTGVFLKLGVAALCATIFCSTVQAQSAGKNPARSTASNVVEPSGAAAKSLYINQKNKSGKRGSFSPQTSSNLPASPKSGISAHYKSTASSPCSDTTTFSNLNIAIPDGDPAGVTDSEIITGITGTLGVNVQLKSVCFRIDHTWVGDLIVTLVAPNGTQIILTDRPGVPASPIGCDGDNMDVCVDIGTGNEMESICSNLPAIGGSFSAANGFDLNDINDAGGSPNGTWQLFASDNVSDDTGTILEWSLVFDDGPVANWISPGTVCASGNPVNLDMLVTGTAGGIWSGTGVTGNTFNPSGLSGLIAITYTVSNSGTGCSDSQTNDIFVDPAVPVAAFNFNAISLSAIFNNTSVAATSYVWDFGDGATSNLENPVHSYSAAGTYTVTLTAINSCGNNVSTQTVIVQNCPDITIDGSFEAGVGSGNWVESSTNFQTPICDLGCDPNGINQARTGDFWAWFGGADVFEEGALTQNFNIAVNSSATLTFWLQIPDCDSPDDFLKVVVDGDTLYAVTGGSNLCGTASYSLQSINLDAYDDGLPHTLTFFSKTYSVNGGFTNFFVDDVVLSVCPGIGFAENNLNQHVSIMPVPARDFINVNFRDIIAADVKIEIADMIGKIIFNTTVRQVNDDQSERIDVSAWSKGVYILKVSSGNNSINRKIVVQ